MSSTIYRKYRPQNFSEIIGQKHIVQTLSNAIKNNRIGQAYLFTGPRGTGKTSVARILAKTVNCQALQDSATCEKCQPCKLIAENQSLDIIEIDAASNTGVDNIRELRETIGLPPTALKYKVYIIDEVHMLSTGAFNALLKTLEEPPAHVIFILATTEIHKVPATILSRCQRFDFTRLPLQNIIEKLSLIAKKEKVSIDADSLEMIAIAAEGGMRDAESLFGQVLSLEDKNITAKEVEEILGTTDRKFSAEVVDLILEKDASGAISKINSLLADGYDLKIFNKSLLNYLRQLMLLKINPELKKHFAYEATQEQIKKIITQAEKAELSALLLTLNLFLEAQNKISASMLPQLPLEIAIIRATHTFPANSTDYTLQETKGEINLQTPAKSAPIAKAPIKKTSVILPEPEEDEPAVIRNLDPSLPDGDVDLYTVQNNWKQLLVEIRNHNHSLAVLLSSNCKAIDAKGNEVTLATPYDFYKEKLNDHENRLTVENVFGKILGLKIRLKILTYKEAGIEIEPPKPEESPSNAGEPARNASLLDDISGNKISGENSQESTDTQKHSDAGGQTLINSALEIMGAKVVEE